MGGAGMQDQDPDRGHMDLHRQNDWQSVRYDARFDEYWVPAGDARQLLFYCPWCGEQLPESRRDLWFDMLDAEGVDPMVDTVPAAYRTGEWRGWTPPGTVERDRSGPIAGRVMNIFDPEEEGGDA